MKNVLFTGGSGFIGRNIKDELGKCCNLYAPARDELNLLNEKEVEQYIIDNDIQIVIHSANPNPVKNELDKQDKMFEDSIRVYANLARAEKHYERMYTFGSGAEYDKSLDMDFIKESDYGRSVPKDTYGLIKYTIHKMIETSEKQYNLRLFAVFGPTDHESKFITHVIRCILRDEDITIRQDCAFDYMYVTDLVGILEYFINNIPKYKEYNVCTGKRIYLSEIADIVKEKMNSSKKIIIMKDGYNRSYTADNTRLMEELGGYNFTSIEEGIDRQIAYEENSSG